MTNQICLPYVDPALLQSRQQIFQLTYGFKCTCRSCVFLQKLGPAPELPTDFSLIGQLLRKHVFRSGVQVDAFTRGNSLTLETLPANLSPIQQETFLASLSEVFSKASHEGPYDIALETGLNLLALYVIIYPRNYPQIGRFTGNTCLSLSNHPIGMHLLEMAKTAWNALVTNAVDSPDYVGSTRFADAKCYLGLSKMILSAFGPEGDEGGPLEEIRILQSLIDKEEPFTVTV
jgi:hypothetical protein